MTYTAQFFAEKLNVPVEYFSPFRSVEVGPTVNREELVTVAHRLGEVVGLGLRNLAHCPVELNLMPDSIRKWRAFNEKKPYLVATIFTVVAVIAVMGYLFQELKAVKDARITAVQTKLAPLQLLDNKLTSAMSDLRNATNDLDQIAVWLNDRYYWVDTLPEFQRLLARIEVSTTKKWNTDAGVWIEQFVTSMPASTQSSSAVGGAPAAMSVSAAETAIDSKFFSSMNQNPGGVTPATAQSGTTITMVLRAIKGPTDAANDELMYAFVDELKSSPLVDPKATQAGDRKESGESPYTFSFAVKVALKNPIKF